MTREEAIDTLKNGLWWDRKQLDEAIDIAISALRPVSRERVEKVWRGKWIHAMPILGSGDEEIRCSKCGNITGFETDFCPYCGNPMTNEAVQMAMERLEAIFSARNDD